MADLRARLGSLTLPNPVLTASGCAGSGAELGRFVAPDELGGFITPSITVSARSGSAMPRTVATPSGMLAATGLPGPGIDAFLAHDLAWLAARGARVIVSLAGTHSDDYATLARALHGHPAVAALEVNLCCPDARGQAFGCDAVSSGRVVGATRRAADPAQSVFAKLTPDVTDIAHVARVCADAGVDGFSLVGAPQGLVIDTDTLAPAVAELTGGLSGPAVRPIALRSVWQVRRAVGHLPIIGSGGIASGLDALQFVLAGASAVAVGTAVLGDPTAPLRVLAELDAALDERGIATLAEAVGLAHRGAAGVRPQGHRVVPAPHEPVRRPA